jgi:hypothetical protein
MRVEIFDNLWPRLERTLDSVDIASLNLQLKQEIPAGSPYSKIMTTLTEVFWVTFVTTVSGMIIKLASMCYKSKCKEVEVCCLKIVRDTHAEEKEEEYRIDHPSSSTSSPRAHSERQLES